MAGTTRDSETWKSLSLTHVEYPKGDFVGFILAWASLLPIFICISLLTIIALRRDLFTISYFVGILLNELLNMVAKQTIQQPRPVAETDAIFTGHGMPSSHAQFMAFATTNLTLLLFLRLHHNHQALDNVWKYLVWLLAVTSTILVIVSRVYLLYHTVSQVLCGAVLGSFLGVLWFFFVHCYISPYFSVIASWRVSEYFMIRDSSLIPNCLWFEYCSHRKEARTRQRKSQQ